MKYPKFSFFGLFLLIITMSFCSTDADPERLHEMHGTTMGTTYMVKLVFGHGPKLEKDIRDGIGKLLKTINHQMSVFDSKSEISQFNQHLENSWFSVSDPLASVVNDAMIVSRLSDGAFDVTVGPLINLWGFGPKKRRENIPKPEEIAEIKNCTGYQKIKVSLNPPQLKKELPCITCNLSAIAKGYGVDQVALYLESRGISRYLVEIGGEIRVKGENQFKRKWRVGIASPDGSFGVYRAVTLKNESMATSGDYFNYIEIKGIRYSHTIDPRTGSPVKHNLASVTVIHPSCLMADAYATAIQVMGPERGYSWAEKHKLAALLLIRQNNSSFEKATEAFSKYIQ